MLKLLKYFEAKNVKTNLDMMKMHRRFFL